MVGLLYVIIASLFKVLSFFVRRSTLGKEVGQTLQFFLSLGFGGCSLFSHLDTSVIMSFVILTGNFDFFREKLDQKKTDAYVDMVLSKLRNLKEEIKKNYCKKNNLLKEQRNSLNKLNSLVKNRQMVICSSDKDGKIVILNYKDYNSIMLRELKDFETVKMVGCTISQHFEQIRETCNS